VALGPVVAGPRLAKNEVVRTKNLEVNMFISLCGNSKINLKRAIYKFVNIFMALKCIRMQRLHSKLPHPVYIFGGLNFVNNYGIEICIYPQTFSAKRSHKNNTWP
jgi:hypothetical protein